MKLELGVKEIFEEVSILIKVTVLCENSVGTPTGLTGEWGLAMLVEVAGQRILFDTGESGKLLSNAAALRVDLRSVDTLVMSHGHYDHAGGMRDFLRYRRRLPVYAHPDFFNLRYSEERYIGGALSGGRTGKSRSRFCFFARAYRNSPWCVV